MDESSEGIEATLTDPATAPDWEAFSLAAASLGAPLSERQVAQFRAYLELLCEWNQRMNLTAVRTPGEILTKHFLDSLTLVSWLPPGPATLLDVGTGAGFPAVPLKIARPELRITLLDALDKRLRFLQRVTEALGLTEVAFCHGRAEDAARADRCRLCGLERPLRERFDVVTARAVAPLNALAEWTLPFARVHGSVIAMKGPEMAEEAGAAEHAIRTLGGGTPEITVLTLPGTDVGRSLVRIPKVRTTPKGYPRLPGSARKHPL